MRVHECAVVSMLASKYQMAFVRNIDQASTSNPDAVSMSNADASIRLLCVHSGTDTDATAADATAGTGMPAYARFQVQACMETQTQTSLVT